MWRETSLDGVGRGNQIDRKENRTCRFLADGKGWSTDPVDSVMDRDFDAGDAERFAMDDSCLREDFAGRDGEA